jgi:cell wall-associated NlpC family hydrolase
MLVMARYTAEQIYAFAREAGFSPDRAATMTAIALAESGGNSSAHNPRGEDSRGLWQINARAHPKLGQNNLYDPVENAKAAFAVSHGGGDVSPWTTTHGGMGARYLRFRAQAEAAAAAYGDGTGRGMWAGTDGYGDHTSAGDAKGGGSPSTSASPSASGSDNVNVNAPAAAEAATPAGLAPGEELGIGYDSLPGTENMGPGGTPMDRSRAGEELGIAYDGEKAPATPTTATPAATTAEATPVTTTAPAVDQTKAQQFLNTALAQSGDQYVWAAEAKATDPNPSKFDCSELVEWTSSRVGMKMPDGAWAQYRHLEKQGTTMSVEEAIKTPGALLFSFSTDPMTGKPKAAHVAISLGNGKTIEAKGSEYGVGSWDASPKRFAYAGMIPDLAGPAVPTGPVPTPAAAQTDAFTYRAHHDPVIMDNNPSALAISHTLIGATPPAGAPVVDTPPAPPPPEQLMGTAGDADGDGLDDALEHANQLAIPADGHAYDDPSDDHHDPTPAH